ncbi:MAG: bifunctional [glutamine synthetase] adenylyltransferase/[glutamine synthetase]-adenylyl-L-tyrosine phosphorylase [Rhodospirillales bacterium]
MFSKLNPASLPVLHDEDRRNRGRDRFMEAIERSDDTEAAERWQALQSAGPVMALLDAVFDHSPFLTAAMCRQPAFIVRHLDRDPAETVAADITALRPAAAKCDTMADLMKLLRQVRERVAVFVALADIGGIWPLESVTGSLSDLADAAVNSATAFLLRQAAAKGEILLANPDSPCEGSGLAIIAMGKHGSRGLNYSSDIDLILLFDRDKVDYRGKDDPQTMFSRLARNLVKALSERTPDGFVFRVDLRLRPDPGSTPPAISIAAAETYYEAMGPNWERAAMIKARAAAGDIETGEEFLRFIQPFVWRKHLDFASIEDIHSIKRQIDRHYGGSEIAVAGHDVKLGRGGIREVEFFVQTQQLIWGGREPQLRGRGTLAMLRELVNIGQVTPEAADELERSYRFLRSIEHRLQMVDDAQTHKLPSTDEGLDTFAAFAGYADRDSFATDLTARLRDVERHYSGLFETSGRLGSEGGSLVFTGVEDDPETLGTMARMGFVNTPSISETIRGWHRGRYRATRSDRTRQYLTELMPRLLAGFASAANPDSAFFNFDRFLAKLPAGVQLFAMFHAHPELLDVVAEIMGGAPKLADQLARRPDRLEALLDANSHAVPPPLNALIADCAESLSHAEWFEELLDAARRWAGDRRFLIGLRILRGQMKPENSGPALSNIAEAVLRVLLPAVEEELAIRHGTIPGGRVMLLGMGKLGSRELMPGSDLDLILLYDAPEGADFSDGEKPLAVSTYYIRLCQRLVNALTALTAEGTLYEIDLRLRPSGNKGPLACSLSSFETYQRNEAWTWEHMALTRARPVAGDRELCRLVQATIEDILGRPRDPDKLLRDVATMRRKMSDELHKGSQWDIKQARGGIVDAEFIVQYLLVREAPHHTVLRQDLTADAIRTLVDCGALGTEEAAMLIEALAFWQGLQAVLRLAVNGEFKPEEASAGLTRMILRAMEAPSIEVLEQHMLETAGAVHDLYQRMIALPAAALGDAGGDDQNSSRSDDE